MIGLHYYCIVFVCLLLLHCLRLSFCLCRWLISKLLLSLYLYRGVCVCVRCVACVFVLSWHFSLSFYQEDITYFTGKLITKTNLRLKQRAPYFGDDPEYVTSHINRKIYAHWSFLAHAPNNMSEFAYVSTVLGHNGRHPLVTAAYTTVGFHPCELTKARLLTQIAAHECVLHNALEWSPSGVVDKI